ncbi:glycosyltransferase family 2 protein [Bdellovibrio sp. 22V]|uniref:dolichyl-phosphate beta-glucosyltransferase n=1 Tax=Bdellovibrio TaxID=958 RepID=UPI002543667E|nr:dolichyl-phosphate beta-glucosyltransferase [Bdellovibrio sp. 22V]WII71619.1 glycosyltransferase family 2 protein [Bdellovibrio sp. 22V]
MSSISVVIPAYNEEMRLPKTLQALQRYMEQPHREWKIHEVIVVNDGSDDGTVATVEQHQKNWTALQLHSFAQNHGKGAAVHEGLRVAKSDWVLIADADMATPWEELEKLWIEHSDAHLVMGSRALPQSDIVVRQHWLRQSMGKTFNKILKLFIGLPFKDTQCGFKLLRNDSFFRAEVLSKLRVQRFAWDVEVILFLMNNKKKIVEVPIRWQHQEASHVHILKDSLEMLIAVLKMKRRVRQELRNGRL